ASRARRAVVPGDEETALRRAPRTGRLFLAAACGRAARRAGDVALAAAARRQPAVRHKRVHRGRAEEYAAGAARVGLRAARLPRANERGIALRLALTEAREDALHDRLALTQLVVRGDEGDCNRVPAENC